MFSTTWRSEPASPTTMDTHRLASSGQALTTISGPIPATSPRVNSNRTGGCIRNLRRADWCLVLLVEFVNHRLEPFRVAFDGENDGAFLHAVGRGSGGR